MKKTYEHDKKKKTDFQQRLIDLRNEKGLTGQQLAAALKVSRDCIVQWENDNDRQPALDKLILLANFYGVSLDYLLGRSCCRSVDNEYIHQQLGLSDKAIDKLKTAVQHDKQLAQSNKTNLARISNDDIKNVRPVLLPLRIPIINFVIESKQFFNLINDFLYYVSSDSFTNFLDGSFKKLPTNTLRPADENFIAGGSEIVIDGDTNKALAKNLLDVRLNRLSEEFTRQQDTQL